MDFQRWLREAAGELSESESPKRDAEILLEHVTAIMEQHFEPEDLGGVVGEIDKLFHQRFDRMVSSLQLGKAPRSGGAPRTGHKPRRPSH